MNHILLVLFHRVAKGRYNFGDLFPLGKKHRKTIRWFLISIRWFFHFFGRSGGFSIRWFENPVFNTGDQWYPAPPFMLSPLFGGREFYRVFFLQILKQNSNCQKSGLLALSPLFCSSGHQGEGAEYHWEEHLDSLRCEIVGWDCTWK